jgi:hypothetical protein
MNRLFVLFQIGRQEQQRAFSQMSVEVEMILFVLWLSTMIPIYSRSIVLYCCVTFETWTIDQ